MLPMRIELIISSLQDWCLTIMALEAYTAAGNRIRDCCTAISHSTTEKQPH